MPSTGTPSSNTACGARAVSSSVTEAWLPERITPRGLKARTNSASTSYGCSSEYTPVSRSLRAMSCVTWEPKSRMRILSRVGFREFERPSGAEAPLVGAAGACPSINMIVRRLLGDLHIVDVGLAHAGGSDLHELGLGVHLLDGAAPGVAHAR